MAERYRVGIGLGLAYAATTIITPQPHSPAGVEAAERTLGADGSVFEAGLHIWLLWSSAGRATKYQTLLAQFNLDVVLRGPVTIWAPDFERGWGLYQGYAIRPAQTTYARFAKDVRILVRDLFYLGSETEPEP